MDKEPPKGYISIKDIRRARKNNESWLIELEKKIGKERKEEEQNKAQEGLEKEAKLQQESEHKKKIVKEAQDAGSDICANCLTLNPYRCSCGVCLECNSNVGSQCYTCWSSDND